MLVSIVLKKKTSAIFLAIVLVLGTIAAISPLYIIKGVNAQGDPYYEMDSYNDEKSYEIDSYGYSDYGMDNNDRKTYDKRSYGNDNGYESQYQSYKPDYKPKHPSYNDKDDRDKSKDNIKKSININKLNCINTNLNINGNNSGNISIGNKGAAEEGYLGAYSAVYGSGGYDNNKKDKGFECIINNNNNNTNVISNDGGNATETASLTVKKEIFGCVDDNPNDFIMVCEELENDSTDWIPCTDPAISGTRNCQDLPANLFDIEVRDNQNTLIRQFDGSLDGTTIQNLQPGTYKVNEIKHPSISGTDQLRENPAAEEACTSDEFPDGGVLIRGAPSFMQYNPICFEYEDEFDNNCSTLTLQPGENKICTVKNYMKFSQPD